MTEQETRKRINPFYVLSVLVGIAFLFTALIYWVMTLRASRLDLAPTSASGQWLMDFMSDYGVWLFVVEIVLLGITTFAAIATDDYWTGEPSAGSAGAGNASQDESARIEPEPEENS